MKVRAKIKDDVLEKLWLGEYEGYNIPYDDEGYVEGWLVNEFVCGGFVEEESKQFRLTWYVEIDPKTIQAQRRESLKVLRHDLVIRNILKQEKLTVEEASEVTGISNRTIENWKRKQSNPSIVNLQEFLNKLGYNIVVERDVTK